jgi:hypothetical protein
MANRRRGQRPSPDYHDSNSAYYLAGAFPLRGPGTAFVRIESWHGHGWNSICSGKSGNKAFDVFGGNIFSPIAADATVIPTNFQQIIV